MPALKLYQIDAFTSEVFRGNPAAVVPLHAWLPDAQMQAIAGENNLSETAFFVPQGDGYKLRWFSPLREVPLCGHATLASGFVLLTLLHPDQERVRFDTLSGPLEVRRQGSLLVMDFPLYDPLPCDPPPALLAGLKIAPQLVLRTVQDPKYYAIYRDEDQVRLLSPDFGLLGQLNPYGVAASASGRSVDFVSRYFAPSRGVPEDPVTGSIHCALVPYWAKRLGKAELHAQQVSRRGGELFCTLGVGRVTLAGYAVKYLEGEIAI